jgi:hypothetical protein
VSGNCREAVNRLAWSQYRNTQIKISSNDIIIAYSAKNICILHVSTVVFLYCKSGMTSSFGG